MYSKLMQDKSFKKLYDIVVRLRGPGGCAWDKQQTALTLRGDLIEETYECIEAIDEQNPPHIKEELGDIFLLITMMAYIYEQEDKFTVSDVLEGISEKLIRRHPHVFEAKASAHNENDEALNPEEILKNWAKMKVEQEGRKPKDSLLDEVSRGLPPLDRAFKLQKKAAKAGFDWPDSAGVLAKIREEINEVESSITGVKNAENSALAMSSLEDELGDLLFSAVNLCRFFKIEPSLALQRTNIKFTERFRHVEKCMKKNGQEMKAENLPLMDRYWEEAKGIKY